jgi:hypothetical protein
MSIFGSHKGYDKCYVSFENCISSIKNTALESNPEHLGFRAFSMHFENAMDSDFIAKELGVDIDKVDKLIAGIVSGYRKVLRRRVHD